MAKKCFGIYPSGIILFDYLTCREVVLMKTQNAKKVNWWKTILPLILLLGVFVLGAYMFLNAGMDYVEARAKFSCQQVKVNVMLGVMEDIERLEENKMLCPEVGCDEEFEDKIFKLKQRLFEINEDIDCIEMVEGFKLK